jgi:serine/threonine protein kinase
MSYAALLAVSPPRLFLPSGTVLEGRYRVERFLGQGATGCVYLATHLSSGEGLALKLVHPVDPGRRPAASAGYLVAARAAARFRSENVAHVRDMGMLEDGSTYLVMEYLEGETLEGHLRVQPVPLPIARAVDIALQAARGLGDAHGADLVHRNARPSKWFLARTPNTPACVKILDFGASKITPRGGGADESRAAGSGAVGAPPYAAPEQIESPAQVDARADVWTVGVVLHELLARAPPFRGETVREARVRALAAAPPALRARRSELAPELEAVVMRCLETNPEARFGSMAELMLALAPFHGAWERSSVTPTPPPVRAALLASTPAPATAVPNPVLPPLPEVTTLALGQAGEKAPGSLPPELLAPEVELMTSVSAVIARPEQPAGLPAAPDRSNSLGARIRSLPRVAIAAIVGVVIGVGGGALLLSAGAGERATNAAPLGATWATASARSRPAAPAPPPSVAATVATAATAPAPQPAPPALDDSAQNVTPSPQALPASSDSPAPPAGRPRPTNSLTHSPATRTVPANTSAPVGTSGFGDRQ